MSWSINMIGTPEKLVEALKKHSETLSGKSKEEFDAALPHMIALIEENKGGYAKNALEISGSGHGYGEDGNLSFSLKQTGFLLV